MAIRIPDEGLWEGLSAGWLVSPGLVVAVDSTGSLVLRTVKRSTEDPGQFMLFQVDVSNAEDLKSAITEAQEYAAAVLPPPAPGRADQQGGMARSLAFTALLEFAWFRKMESRLGGHIVTQLVSDYENDTAFQRRHGRQPKTLWEYTKGWVKLTRGGDDDDESSADAHARE